MDVHLISHTPEPERTAAAAARLYYTDISVAQLRERMKASQVEDLLLFMPAKREVARAAPLLAQYLQQKRIPLGFCGRGAAASGPSESRAHR